MDKFLSSSWFVRLLSFVIALMLFAVVSVEQNGTDGIAFTGGEDEEAKLLEDVPVEVVYDDKNYIISGVPETVSVELQGSDDSILSTSLKNTYKVVIDLTGKKTGTYTVRVQPQGFPDDVDVATNPVEVTIYEKATETFPVQIDLTNKDKIAEGYEVGQPIVTPNQVRVTGAKQNIDEIAFVKGIIDVEGADDTIEKTVTLNVYDQNGNELNLQLETPVVEVKVPITGPSKTVPIKLSREASLPDGLSVQSVEIEPSEVTLFGPKEVLKEISFIDGLELNLEEISKDTTLELEVPVPDGVNKINPKTVKVTIDVANQEEKTIKDVPIEVIGLSDELNVSFEDPAEQTVDVTIKGSKEVLDKIKASDIESYIDVSDLSTGQHSVEIDVNGPQNMTSELETEKAKIKITENQ